MGSAGPKLTRLNSVGRAEATIETERTYDGVRPVVVRIRKREGRYKITDDGAAVSAAGVGGLPVAYPGRIALGEYSVNVSRGGVVWLPAVGANDERLAKLCDLVSEGSISLYERLLELEGAA